MSHRCNNCQPSPRKEDAGDRGGARSAAGPWRRSYACSSGGATPASTSSASRCRRTLTDHPLADRLEQLEQAGIVERLWPHHGLIPVGRADPPHREYALTDRGPTGSRSRSPPIPGLGSLDRDGAAGFDPTSGNKDPVPPADCAGNARRLVLRVDVSRFSPPSPVERSGSSSNLGGVLPEVAT